VHEIRDWNDLRMRIDSPGRRCYAFFHPALVDEPLIFVEVALTRGIPDKIDAILSANGQPVDLERATSAVFYSISNCQMGLTGVSFGHFLIKQVVEEVQREMPRLATFVTLSPAPGFAEWLKRERASDASATISDEDRAVLAVLDRPGWWRDEETAEVARGCGLFFARAHLTRAAARCGGTIPPRQRRPARTAQLPRRYLAARTGAVTRLDGELPL